MTHMNRDEWNALVERARNVDLRKILNYYHVKLEPAWANAKYEFVGPCPVCAAGNDRFSVNFKKEVFNCRICAKGGKGAIDLEMFLSGVEFVEAVNALTNITSLNGLRTSDAEAEARSRIKQREQAEAEQAQHDKARWLWSQRRPIVGTIAEKYLRGRRIICALPTTLGFLPARKPEHHPALIAAFALVDEPEPGIVGTPRNVGAVHLTLLKPDGSGKAEINKPKLMIGSPAGLPIVLAAPNDLMGLAISEGIEDALSIHEATGLGAWAAGAASFLPKLADVVPSCVEAVTIYAHADKAGENGARNLVQALHRRDLEVSLEGLA
jgi:putative DNA primase/helicase